MKFWPQVNHQKLTDYQLASQVCNWRPSDWVGPGCYGPMRASFLRFGNLTLKAEKLFLF